LNKISLRVAECRTNAMPG